MTGLGSPVQELMATNLSLYLDTDADTQIGRILDALQQSGEAENTYVIFSDDHCLAVGNHGLLGNQNKFDHSVRVPFIIRGPEVAANRKNTKPISDAMSTET